MSRPRLLAYRWLRAFLLGVVTSEKPLEKPSATIFLSFVHEPTGKWYEAGRRLGKGGNE
jgi:hypothetical protein